MKYIIPQDKVDKIVFRYLDMNLKGLEKKKPRYSRGYILVYPDEEFGILGWETNGTLNIYEGLVDEISTNFGMNRNDSKLIISRWFSDRYKLMVKKLNRWRWWYVSPLAIDTN